MKSVQTEQFRQSPPISNSEVRERLPNIDYVYHVTTADTLGTLHTGLQPNPERVTGKSWRPQLDQLLDEVRPQRVIDMGISRLTSIFAHPEAEVARHDHSERSRKSRQTPDSHHVILQASVDPGRVLVCDMAGLDELAMLAVEGDLATAEPKYITSLATNYWEKSVTLADFRSKYEAIHTDYGSTYERRDPDDRSIPYRMLAPEVLIPLSVAVEQLQQLPA